MSIVLQFLSLQNLLKLNQKFTLMVPDIRMTEITGNSPLLIILAAAHESVVFVK